MCIVVHVYQECLSSFSDDSYDGNCGDILRPLLAAVPRDHSGGGTESGDLQPELHARSLGFLPLAVHE